MAYIVNTTQTATASAATYTVTLGAHQSGDLLLVCLSNDGGGTTLAPDATSATAGWAMIGTQAASGGVRGAWAYLIADSSSEVNPVFTGANASWIATCVVIRDAHATAPFGSLVSGTDFVRTDWNNVSSSASGSLTSAVNECLLLYSWCCDASNGFMVCGPDEATSLDLYASSFLCHIVAFRQQQTAAAAPTVTMKHPLATEGGNGWVLAIRNKSGGVLQPDVRLNASTLKWHGRLESAHDSITWQSPNNFTATINSISTSSTAPTTDVTQAVWVDAPWNTYTRLQTAESTAGNWSGGTFTISSTDMTGKIFSIEIGHVQSSSVATVGDEGFIVGFSDGTNWVTYQLAKKLIGWPSGIPKRYFVVLGNATVYASSGSINWAAVTRVAYLSHRIGSSTAANGLQVRNAVLFSSAALTGGGSSLPLKATDYVKYAGNFGFYDVANLQSSAQVKTKIPLQIGDGTNVTYFDGAAQSVEFPQRWSATKIQNWQMDWNANASTVSLAVKAGASDTIKLAAGVAATDTLQSLTIDAASSTSAAYDFGQSFVGWSPTWKTGVACANATFSGCDPVNFKGTTVTNVIVKNTLAGSTEAAVIFDESGATVTGTTIDVSGSSASYHLELGTSVTAITLANVTFSGTPVTDKVHVKRTTGTVTITTSGTTSLFAADVTSDGATVVIAAPQVYQTVTVSGLTVGSRVQIYDTTSSTELSNSIAAGTSVTWTDANPAVGSRDIRVRITYVSGATAKEMIESNIGTCGTTEPSNAVSFLANQVNDTTYNTNAVDGSTVTGITINDTTEKVEIAIAGGTVPWKDIYAYQVYWLNTATGIQDDFAFIEAPDTANYLVTSFKIKNTSSPSVPLVITSGYGRDATTGSVEDIMDTSGGSIFPAPDHVVEKIVTVGGVNVITGDIADVPTASEIAAAVTGDSKTLTVGKFLGLK